MPDKKGQINFVGDPNFALDNGVFSNTLMEKMRNRKLSISAIKVYMYLLRNRDIKSGKLHGTKVETIADYWKISTRTVHRALGDLTDAGLYEPPLRGGEEITGVLLPNQKNE